MSHSSSSANTGANLPDASGANQSRFEIHDHGSVSVSSANTVFFKELARRYHQVSALVRNSIEAAVNYITKEAGEYCQNFREEFLATTHALAKSFFECNSILLGKTIINTEFFKATGTAKDDALVGNSYSNALTGGKGNDWFFGDTGSDTYLFSKGDGKDLIQDYGADATYTDTIEFDDTVLADTIALFKKGQDLYIAYGDTDIIKVDQQISSGAGIEKIELDDGKYLSNSDINLVIQEINAFASDHGITLTSVNDVKGSVELMNIVANAWHS